MLSGPPPLLAPAAPDLGADAPAAPGLALLTMFGRFLVSLDEWPEDHQIHVDGTGPHAPLTFGRVRTARQVIDILFDPATGQFHCIACQDVGVDWPAGIAPAPDEGSFLHAVVQGLAASAAAALLRSPGLLDIWAWAAPSLARWHRADVCRPRCLRWPGWRCACSS